MRWVAIFTDTPAMLAVRVQWGQAHLNYLEKHEHEIVLAGGCRHEEGGNYIGGLWVLEVPNRERAVELIEQDPYFVHGARQYELRTWGKAFEDRQVLL